jgi:hypothetical protein
LSRFDFKQSFERFKKWFALYRQSILMGGGMGVAVVVIALLVSRCGGHAKPSAKVTAPPDAAEEQPPVAPAASPVPADAPDAPGSDATKTGKKKPQHKGSGSAH